MDIEQKYVSDHLSDVATCLTERMAATPTGYPLDVLTVHGDIVTDNGKTSPTNIGLYLASLVAFRDIGVYSESTTNEKLARVLSSLEMAPHYKGLFYNWYDTATGRVSGESGSAFISAVDNAWLAAGMIVAKQAVPELSDRYEQLLERMKFNLLYDRRSDSFYGGLDGQTGQPSMWHYDVVTTEARIASYIGVGRYGLPVWHAERLARQLIKANDASGLPKSWGGSMFEMCMPGLFVDEGGDLTPQGMARHRYIQAQIDYGREYCDGHWGLSPCESPNKGYVEAGVPSLALRDNGEGKAPGYAVHSVITPHAVALALPYIGKEALQELQHLEDDFPGVYSPGYGFADSVDIIEKTTCHSYLALDQSMIALSLHRYITGSGVAPYMQAELLSGRSTAS